MVQLGVINILKLWPQFKKNLSGDRLAKQHALLEQLKLSQLSVNKTALQKMSFLSPVVTGRKAIARAAVWGPGPWRAQWFLAMIKSLSLLSVLRV